MHTFAFVNVVYVMKKDVLIIIHILFSVGTTRLMRLELPAVPVWRNVKVSLQAGTDSGWISRTITREFLLSVRACSAIRSSCKAI